MEKKFVLNKTTKQVKRWGYVNFNGAPEFDSETEEVIVNNTVLSPDIDVQDWYWNSSTEEFQQTQP